jgi:hypothetical protein
MSNDICLRVLVTCNLGQGVAQKPTNGRQDKSADLWSGACGWSSWIFQAFDHHCLLALNAFSSRNSNFQPPSHGQAGLFQP